MATPSVTEFEREISARLGRQDFIGAGLAAGGCRSAWPSAKAGWVLGSIAALCLDEKDNALALIDQCLAAHPGDVQCLLQRAECLLALGRRADALQAVLAATGDEVTDPIALDAAGHLLVNMQEHPRALALYDRAVSAAPGNVTVLARRALLHRLLGNFDLAARDHEAVLAISPSDPEALKALTELRRQTPEHNCVALLEGAMAQSSPEASAALHFGLAKCYEDLGDHARSWQHLTLGNRLERSRRPYSRETDRAVIEQIIAAFPTVEMRGPDTTGERPIFIVGMPRTGTTLVDRIVSNHSQVHSAGELASLSAAIGKAVNRSARPVHTWIDFAGRLSSLEGESIAREYLSLSFPHRGDKPRFSDKQPVNFFHCALILRAFPRAHIIHLTRHPLAACYAVYKTRFSGGAFPFAYDLEELGDFYAGYRRLMAHWHRVLPGRILDVAYEDLVTAQEATTRRMLEYLELPFEQACLDFHLNPAPMTTSASAVQVRQPLYSSSLRQWQHHAQELAPLRKRLEAAGVAVD